MISIRRTRRVAILAGLSAIVALMLVSCSPAEPAAVRLNQDGSVDFVSCIAVEEVVTAIATTTFRTGDHGTIDESTANSVDLAPPIDHLDVGEVVTFVGLPDEWDRLDVSIDDVYPGNGAYANAERDKLKIGEWRWMDEGGILSSSSRCDIGDGD